MLKISTKKTETKLTNKTSISKNFSGSQTVPDKNAIALFEEQIKEAVHNIGCLEKKIFDLRIKKLEEEIKPFKFGDEVIFTYNVRGKLKDVKGILCTPEFDTGNAYHSCFPRFRAYKLDGTLSDRLLNVYNLKDIKKA